MPLRLAGKLVTVTIFLIAAGALAQPPAPRPAPAGPVTIVHAGRLLDRPGRPPRGPSTITVQGGRIVAVEDGLRPPPAGAALSDLSARFVLPGLIDSHVHLDSDAGGIAALVEEVTENAPRKTLRTLANARKTLEAGFTTVRNLGDGSGATLAIRDAAARGEVDSPRIVDAGRSISATSGHMDSTLGLSDELHASIPQDNSVRRRRILPVRRFPAFTGSATRRRRSQARASEERASTPSVRAISWRVRLKRVELAPERAGSAPSRLQGP